MKYLHTRNALTCDSLKVNIPYKYLLKNTTIGEHLLTMNESGEFIDRKQNPEHWYKCPDDILNTKYRLTNDGGRHVEKQAMVEILVTSMLLKEDYFEGITPNNIERVYNTIIEQGVVSIPYEQFLKCRVNDVDMKYDFNVGGCHKEYVKRQRQRTKPEFKTIAKVYSQNTNTGIQWGFRRNSIAKAGGLPFLKFYSKKRELVNHDTKLRFYQKYLQHVDMNQLDKLMRIELTLGNRKQLLAYGFIKDSETAKLGAALQTIQDKGTATMNNIIKLYVDAGRKTAVNQAKQDIDDAAERFRKKGYKAIELVEHLYLKANVSELHLIHETVFIALSPSKNDSKLIRKAVETRYYELTAIDDAPPADELDFLLTQWEVKA